MASDGAWLSHEGPPLQLQRLDTTPPSLTLGRLEPVDPRVVWKNEALDFTPWLLANGDRLSAALGIDLELEAAEHAVGGYSLDLRRSRHHKRRGPHRREPAQWHRSF